MNKWKAAGWIMAPAYMIVAHTIGAVGSVGRATGRAIKRIHTDGVKQGEKSED